MKNAVLWLLVAVLLIGGGALVFYPRGADEAEPAPVASGVVVPLPAAEPAQPRFPIPEPRPVVADEAQVSVEPEPALPELDDSDAALEPALVDLLGQQSAIVSQLVLKDFIRRVVVTVDNLPQSQLPQRFLPVQPVGGLPRVSGDDDSLELSRENYQRYERHVRLLEELDSSQLVLAYIRFYPLFQEAYEQLGYPNAYFNDRLVEVIDHLLAGPQVTEPVRLVQPSVMYRFADPELEALSAGQKLLLRVGPENATRVQAKLRELRAELLAQAAGAR